MERHEIDSVMHALGEVFELHSKKISPGAFNFWSNQVFGGHDYQVCLDAVTESGLTGKYAPKPNEIIAAIKSKEAKTETPDGAYRGNDPDTKRALESTLTEVAPDNIGDAWRYYHFLIYENYGPGGEPKTQMTKEEALIIVNKSAAKFNMPEAIEPQYRIQSYFENNEGVFL